MTTIYLIRHGVTNYNDEKKFQGISDISLNDAGIRQAQCLAPYFEQIHLDKLYVSTLKRTSETAIYLAESKGLQLEIFKGLEELDGGYFEGRTNQENALAYPELVNCYINCFPKFHAPGGESVRQAYDRMIKAMNTIIAQNKNKTIAVISHGYAIQLFLTYVMKVPFEKMEMVDLKNACVNKLLVDEDNNISIAYMNDTQHLPAELV